MVLAVIVVLGASGAAYLNIAKPDVGDAPNIKVEVTPERVARGEYLANCVAVCMDCHSKRDWTLFCAPIMPGTFGAGGELFDQKLGFPGAFYSKNITPYGLKDWTDGEIYRAITTGVTKEGEPIMPVMPYHYYGQVDSQDIISIIAYLRSLPETKSERLESKADFPFSLIVRTIPHKSAQMAKPAETDSLTYGKYVTLFSGCVECHTQVNDKAQLIAGTEFGGGRVFTMPGGNLTTPNITFDITTGIGTWSKEQFVARFKAYADSNYHPHKVDPTKDFVTIMPWMMYANMKQGDLEAIYVYLKSIKPITHKVEKWKPTATVAAK